MERVLKILKCAGLECFITSVGFLRVRDSPGKFPLLFPLSFLFSYGGASPTPEFHCLLLYHIYSRDRRFRDGFRKDHSFIFSTLDASIGLFVRDEFWEEIASREYI